MIITCYITGYTVLYLFRVLTGWQVRKTVSCLYAGIAAVTVYAQFFSLFYKVGLAANAILVVCCIVCAVILRKEMIRQLFGLRQWITPVKAGVILLLFLLFAYGTSRGILHYDTALYHAQSIRWIEEYGVIKGLGNLHSRLAYNSASFCLSALYSFAFVTGQSFHSCAGFMAFLLALVCTLGRKQKSICLSDLVRIMALYYLMNIFDEMVSPASDYFMVLGAFYLIIAWLELLEEGEKSAVPFGLLSVFSVWLVTVKLSGALLLLLAVKPAVNLLKEKKGKETALFLGTGVLTALPFLIRNVILSGWLLYPFTFIDLFDFPFQIPKGMASYDAKEIQAWGRGFSDAADYDKSFTEWFPGWAEALDTVNKGFLILAVSGLAVFLLLCIYALRKKRRDMGERLFLTGTLGVCFLFWLTSAPLIRYGCIFLWLFPVLVWGSLYLEITPGFDRYRLMKAVLLLVCIYKAGAFTAETVKNASPAYLLKQKDYENFETVAYELHGYTFYYPAEGDRTGYQDFPAAPVKAEDIFLGDTIEEGFKDVIHS
jgi:hypothetical protein